MYMTQRHAVMKVIESSSILYWNVKIWKS